MKKNIAYSQKDVSMKKLSSLALVALIMGSQVNNVYAIRLNTLRIGCGVAGLLVAGAVAEGLKRGKVLPSYSLAAAAGLVAGIIVAGVPYAILSYVTPEVAFDSASAIIDEIQQTNPIAGQSFSNKSEFLSMLKGLFYGEMWLIRAKNDLEPIQERVVKALELIGTAKEGAFGDVEFVAKCDELAKRARKVLQNVSVALKTIEEAISSNSWESSAE